MVRAGLVLTSLCHSLEEEREGGTEGGREGVEGGREGREGVEGGRERERESEN